MRINVGVTESLSTVLSSQAGRVLGPDSLAAVEVSANVGLDGGGEVATQGGDVRVGVVGQPRAKAVAFSVVDAHESQQGKEEDTSQHDQVFEKKKKGALKQATQALFFGFFNLFNLFSQTPSRRRAPLSQQLCPP